MVRTLVATLTLALLSGCGSQKPPVTPEGEEKVAEASSDNKPAETNSTDGSGDAAKPEGDASATDKPEAKPAASKASSETETLARDIVKGGGRRIGYSASKKMFVVPYEKRTESSFSLDVHFYGEDGANKDPMRVCQPGECEEHLDEILKDFLPKLTAKLDEGGYVSIRSIGWPDGRDDLEVSSLGMKLKYTNGRLEGLKEGKKATPFTVVGSPIQGSALKAIFIVPDSKLLAVLVSPTKANGVVQTFHLFKMP